MKLYDYQEKAVGFQEKCKKIYLALDLGMGKTITAISAAKDFGAKNILVVAEKNEIVNSQNFSKETNMFDGLTYINLREESLPKGGFSRYVCGINPDGLIKHDLKEILENFDAMIVDEATFAKTITTRRFKQVKKIADGMEYLSLLSGTPMMNGASELYAPLLLLNHPMVAGKGREGKLAFEKVFAGGHYRKIRNTGKWFQDYAWWAKGSNYVRELRWLIRDNFFFMQKSETGLFKKKQRTIKAVPMGMDWLIEYTSAWDEYLKKAEKRSVNMDNVIELRNLIENGQMYQVNSKWKAKQVVKDIVDGEYGKDRIVIFSMFIDTDELIQSELKRLGVSFKTFDEIREWKGGDEQVLVGRIKANGKGSNLPEARVCLFVDMDFVPSNNIQAENRIDRPEQTSDMLIVYYMTEGDDVIDRHVRDINKDKMRKIEKFMAPLTVEEIQAMPEMLANLCQKFPKETGILGI